MVEKSTAKPAAKSAEDKSGDTTVQAQIAEVKADAKAEVRKEDGPKVETARPEEKKTETGVEPVHDTDPRLDNRTGDQAVTDESWARKPQQVNGPEIGGDARTDNSHG